MISESGWLLWALLAAVFAVFAALTTVFAKLGVETVHPDLATLLRTGLIVLLLAVVVAANGKWSNPLHLSARAWGFLALSALATGASWICYFRALKLGPAASVAAVDKLSIALVALFAAYVLHERPGARGWIGILLMAAGALLPASRK
jgi:transporter family protein